MLTSLGSLAGPAAKFTISSGCLFAILQQVKEYDLLKSIHEGRGNNTRVNRARAGLG